TLSGADFADVEGFVDSLRRELEKFANDRAAERGYGLLAPAAVSIEQDASLPAGSFQVHAAVVDVPIEGPAPAPAALEDFGQPRAMRPLEMPVGPTGVESLYLVGDSNG